MCVGDDVGVDVLLEFLFFDVGDGVGGEFGSEDVYYV